MASPPTEYFILSDLRTEGATIGHLADNPIVETVIDASGHRYRYVGVASRAADGRFDVDALQQANGSFAPGLSISWTRRVHGRGKFDGVS